MEEANTLIGTGKRHLIMGDAVSAVNVLQDACSILAKKYGDTADECGEAFFLCGKALLNLARMENTVLGNALEGVPEEDAEEEKPKDSNIESTENVDEKTRDELRVQVYDAMAEEEKKDSEESSVKEDSEGSGLKEKELVTNGHVNGAAPADGQTKQNRLNGVTEKSSAEHPEEEEKEEEDKEGGQDGEAEEEAIEDIKDSDDEEEVGNLQLAWEMLEIAKVIYKRKESKEDQLLAAQAHLKLGEVAAESGNYSQAVEDFQECLALQQKHLPNDSRFLAETHCQLGLNFTLTDQYSQAIEQFNSSIAVINSRLAKLQVVIEQAEGPEAASEERKEVEELKALLPDIKEKIEDASEGLKMGNTAAEAIQGALSGESPFPAPSAQNGTATASVIPVKFTNGNAPAKSAASDISHLVRKKRKPDESPVKDVKKYRPL
ncbi:nuclear autoantigenic sperm protein-like [Osmerus eperlanus]|uniref:nuclear autoantigenic sperm protein-like n=1 Tax=Osmerus eperlanus TaxID=29151 RepID=UPI002E1534B4